MDNFDNNNYEYRPRRPKSRISTAKLVLIALIFSLIGALIGGAVVGTIAQEKLKVNVPQSSTQEILNINTNDSVDIGAAVAAKNLDSVVGISTKTTMRDIFNRTFDSQAIGSGFIVNKEGYIVTNDHVIASLSSQTGYSAGAGYADDIQVVFNSGDQLPAKVLWSDSNLDLAILKIEPDRELSVVTLGDSDQLKIGETVFAIGNPLALEFHGTFTGGYVSGLNRSLTGQGVTMTNLIQTDASINSGNSGGPLFNSKGEVVGINTAKIPSGEGLGFSIEINIVKPILEGIIKDGKFEKVSMGVYTADIDMYEKYIGQELEGINNGAVIAQIASGSPAQKAGLKSNDIITKIDGKVVEDSEGLRQELYNYKFGDVVTVEFIRDGKTETVELEFFHYKVGE